VIDRALGGADLPARVAEAVRAGVDWVQIRDRDLDGAPLLRHAEEIATAARAAAAETERGLQVLVNRRVDVALAMGADGVHLGGDGMEVASARALLPAGSLIGVSTHSPAEARAATAADYVHLAPVYRPRSKPATRPPLGCAAVGEAAAAGVPLFAQGGIDAGNAGAVLAAGARGVAVTGVLLAADDIAAATRALRRALDSAAAR